MSKPRHKTLKRWAVTGAAISICSIALWWNAPKVINSDYWWLGFAMEGVAIASPAWLGVDMYKRLHRATRMAVLIHSRTELWFSTKDCLDLPALSEEQILERLAVFNSDRTLFDSPLDVLEKQDEI